MAIGQGEEQQCLAWGRGGVGGDGPPVGGDRLHPVSSQRGRGHRLWPDAGLQDEPGGPAGLPEAPAVGDGGGEGEGGQGGGLAGRHPGQGYRQKGEVLGFPLVPHQLHI